MQPGEGGQRLLPAETVLAIPDFVREVPLFPLALYHVLHICYRYGFRMTTVTVSPKYQIVIPSEARAVLGVKPGQKIEVIVFEGRLELIPVPKVEEARGWLRGIDTSVPREDDRL